jgi:membrane protein DedA with SNARE-associated domain
MIAEYGYVALLMGMLVEGEMCLLVAGFLAHEGYLSIPWVAVTALAGAWVADQTFFWLGYLKGFAFLQSRPKWNRKADTVKNWLHRFRWVILIGYRFAYGFRSITPFVIGATGLRPRVFIPISSLGIAAWVLIYSSLGFFVGETLGPVLDDLKRHQAVVLLVVGLVIGAVVMGVRFISRLRPRREQVP